MIMKKFKVLGLLIIGLFLISACGLSTILGSQEVITGSGNVVTENRPVSGFDGVSHTGIGRVIITQGDQESLTIEADDNILEYITSEVRGGTLELGFEEDVSFDSVSPILFQVGAKNLSAIDSVGTGTVEMAGLNTDQLEISTNGTGSITIDELSASNLVVDAAGTGDTKLAGAVESQQVMRVGTGNYEASELESRTASVQATGTSSVVVWVLDSLEVEITGTSEVSYYGSPNVTQNITGTGSLTSLGDK
jgi:hypothetical protein